MGRVRTSHGEAGVVAIFCGHLVDGTAPTVFGDGGQTRDWVDVSDVVAANLLAADAALTGPVNIGHGQETSVLDLVRALDEVSPDRRLPEPSFVAERPGEVRRSCLDVTRARNGAGLGGSRLLARRPADDPRRALTRPSPVVVA